MAIDDSIEQLPVDKHDLHKVFDDLTKWEGKNHDKIVLRQFQPAIDKAYDSLDKLLKDTFTPQEKKGDSEFVVGDVNIRGKKDEVYKALNAFVVEFFKGLKYDGPITAAKDKAFTNEKMRFEFYVTEFDRLTGASAPSRDNPYDAEKNPTLAHLIEIADDYSRKLDADEKEEKSDAPTVGKLHEAMRKFAKNEELAKKAYNQKLNVPYSTLLKGMDPVNCGLWLKGEKILENNRLRIKDPRRFHANLNAQYGLYSALRHNQPDVVVALAKQLGLEAQYKVKDQN